MSAAREHGAAGPAALPATDICTKVVNAVRGDIEHGDDSALFKALGYVPKSERKSGLRRMATLLKKAA